MSKFLKFEKVENKPEYFIKNKREEVLGHVFMYKPWKKWVFEPAYDEIIMDVVCLRNLANFMENLK